MRKISINYPVLTPDTINKITLKIQVNWSRYQITGGLKGKLDKSIKSVMLKYKNWFMRKNSGVLYVYLRLKARKYTSRNKNKQAGRRFIKDRVGIEGKYEWALSIILNQINRL